jgi:DNA-binding Xre family transcriptional regulator
MRLKERIDELGFKSKDFAERVGTDAPMISKFANYKCLPIPAMMELICKELECEINDIYENEEIYYQPTKKRKTKKADNYKLTVRLPKEAKEFFKKALTKCGYRDITDWITKCYNRLQARYEIILKAEKKEKALRK